MPARLLSCAAVIAALGAGRSARGQTPPAYDLLVSGAPNRSNAVALDGLELTGNLYIFASPAGGIARVRFWLDDPLHAGLPIKIESFAPFDFAGTAANGTALPFNSTTLPDGSHTVSAEIDTTSGATLLREATFTLENFQPALAFSTALLSLALEPDIVSVQDVQLTSSDGAAAAFSVSDDAAWLEVAPASGSTSATLTLTIDTTGLGTGSHVAMITATSPTHQPEVMTVSVSIGGSLALLVSTSSNRSNAELLDGFAAQGNMFAFVAPEQGIARVLFFLDNPAMTGSPTKIEGQAPYDLGGTAAGGSALPFNTTTLADGPHTLTARVELSGGGVSVLNADFEAANEQVGLHFDALQLAFTLEEDEIESKPAVLSTSDGGPASFTITDDAAWLSVMPATGSLPGAPSLSVIADSTGLAPANYAATVQASAAGYAPALMTVTLSVGSGGFDLLQSASSNRSNPQLLEGGTAGGDMFVFVSPATGITRVRFYLDDPQLQGPPIKTENSAPWDLGGTASNGTALPFNTQNIAEGLHTLSAVLDLTTGGSTVVSANFQVLNASDQIHLAWVDDPATTLTVVWRTLDPSVPSQIHYRAAGQPAWLTVAGQPRPSGTTGTLHEVNLSGLVPDTTYEYQVPEAGGGFSATMSTRTAPPPGPADFTAVFVADTGIAGRLDGLTTGTQQVLDEIAALDPRVLLLGGDYAYFDTDQRYDTVDDAIDAWFGQMQPLASRAPLMPVYGNHEVLLGEGFEAWSARFPTPDGFDGRRDFSFDIGNVHFVSILAVHDTQGLPAATLQWIEDDITAALAAGQDWIVPYLHVSPFSDGTNHGQNLALRAQLGPIFESLGVQLVLTAHDQAFERSYPLEDIGGADTPTSGARHCYGDGAGVVWAKISPGGKISNINGDFAQFASPVPPDWTAVRDNSLHHYAVLTASSAGTLRLETWGVAGDGGAAVLMDRFVISQPACAPELAFDHSQVQLQAGTAGGTVSTMVSLSASDGAPASFTILESAGWLTVTPAGGSTPASLTLSADTTGLAAGRHVAGVRAVAAGHLDAVMTVVLQVTDDYALLASSAANRSNPQPLAGLDALGNVYVFVEPTNGIQSVSFWLDDPDLSGPPIKTESTAPYDFAGTAANGQANALDTTTLTDGAHTISAIVETGGGDFELHADFTVINDLDALLFIPQQLSLGLEASSGPASMPATLQASDDAAVDFMLADDADWLTVEPTDGTTPVGLTLTADPSSLDSGVHIAHVTATADGYAPAQLEFVLTYDSGDCEPVPCAQILVDLPYVLDFESDHGGVAEEDGLGTGFTYIDPPQSGSGYLPDKLELSPAQGVLEITTNSGLNITSSNSLQNAISVGFDGPSQTAIISTTLLNPPAGTGKYQQAGLWFGNNQDNYVKLVLISTPSGLRLEALLEVSGAVVSSTQSAVLGAAPAQLRLILTSNPVARTVHADYGVNGEPLVPMQTFSAPPEFFSFDGAGIDPQIGTRSFAGLMASHRNGPAPLVYTFGEFSVEAMPLQPTAGTFEFTRSSVPVTKPTSMVWGPDDRLYVTELLGTIHALSYGADQQLLSDEIIGALTGAYGPRLTLGITVDPASTPQNVILWVAHSSPSLNDGVPDSGTVTRLSGPGFSTVQDVITGLPRAKANHAVNALHFGADGLLYIAVGGNTGAGAPNTAATEFGLMEEQPLSAAILAADVYAPGFDGSCHNASNIFGPPPCDVVAYATGLRNAYDFTFHSNGLMYAPDNGLGVTGSYPPSPTAPCLGLASPAPYNQGGHNPGTQQDILHVVEQGRYYGHPNPHRNECVFGDGGYQGVAPLPNYDPPIFLLGNNTSSNGTIEYLSDAFCGRLSGQLLIANYSIGDDVVHLELSPDGRSVLSSNVIANGFNDPLPLAQGPDGTIYVGEFGGDLVTALMPLETGCWAEASPLPASRLDAGGAALNGKLYVVGGKVLAGPVSTTFVYNPATDQWTSAASLPSPAVENPAAVGLAGKLYAFGGSTAPFSGAVANSAAYNPATNAWTPLAALPTARGGAAAAAINGLIYVVGGMNGSGASVDTLEVYNPATNVWSTAAAMPTRRDNPGAAVVDGKLHVFGGRTREANGTETNGTLQVVEMYDPATNSWSPRAPMPTGRRTMAVGTLGGRVQLMGGERTPEGLTFSANEQYDPATDTWTTLNSMLTPRHGMAFGTIDGVVYTAGGGTVAGSSFTSIVETFTLEEP